MREVTGSTWTFQIMIIFIFIFSCFLMLSLSYSKVYTIKNRSLTIIEKYEGINTTSADLINSFVLDKGYKTTGACETNWYGAVNLNGAYEKAKGNKSYYYCFREVKSANKKVYYEIKFFFKFNLPFIGDIITYSIKGETNAFRGSEDRITN